jgi:hypothetical protein
VATTVLEALRQQASMTSLEAREHAARQRWLAARRADAEWAGTYFVPWVGRKLRGRSVGVFVEPKLPELTAFRSAC